jgi:hypothetical protein
MPDDRERHQREDHRSSCDGHLRRRTRRTQTDLAEVVRQIDAELLLEQADRLLQLAR